MPPRNALATARERILAEWERMGPRRPLLDYPLTVEDWRTVDIARRGFLHQVRLVALAAIERQHGEPGHERHRGYCPRCRAKTEAGS